MSRASAEYDMDSDRNNIAVDGIDGMSLDEAQGIEEEN